MDSKQAIKVLHNNQYQKHLGNGEYDYIHPLTDAEAKAIEELIQQQDKMLELACMVLTENGIGCPASIDTIEWPECDDKCDVDDIQECTCWRKYLQSEVSK